jgi:hypothetical protein
MKKDGLRAWLKQQKPEFKSQYHEKEKIKMKNDTAVFQTTAWMEADNEEQSLRVLSHRSLQYAFISISIGQNLLSIDVEVSFNQTWNKKSLF